MLVLKNLNSEEEKKQEESQAQQVFKNEIQFHDLRVIQTAITKHDLWQTLAEFNEWVEGCSTENEVAAVIKKSA